MRISRKLPLAAALFALVSLSASMAINFYLESRILTDQVYQKLEATAVQPLPERPLPVSEKRLRRRVATDCLVDVDAVRYSVPHRLVKEDVEVLVLVSARSRKSPHVRV